MKNRFYTLLVIPEKTSQVRKLVMPAWILKGSLVGLFFVGVLGSIMLLDYWYVMSQINENKNLKIQNRRLTQQVQIFKNRMESVESTMERINTFATRLKVITNIEDRDDLVSRLNQSLPDASNNIGSKVAKNSSSESDADPLQSALDPRNPELAALRAEKKRLDRSFSKISYDSLMLEQRLQDLYELLVDQKVFLSALPTRKPAVGYFTSGFGVRKSPYGTRIKMHEGLDIANHYGTPIKSSAYGTVAFSGRKPGYGRTVILNHGYGLETWYAHAWKLLVKKGQKIHRGEKIALMGSTGRSTGPHVHYEVRIHGIPVDPLSYILEE